MSRVEYEGVPAAPQVSAWAAGGMTFAASMLVLIGIFQVLAGIVAIADDQFFVVGKNYTFDLDVTAWGWVHLILGIIIVATGVGLFAARAWAGAIAIFVAMLSAIQNFFFIPYYPWWALLIIALDSWVIWSLTRSGAVRA